MIAIIVIVSYFLGAAATMHMAKIIDGRKQTQTEATVTFWFWWFAGPILIWPVYLAKKIRAID